MTIPSWIQQLQITSLILVECLYYYFLLVTGIASSKLGRSDVAKGML